MHPDEDAEHSLGVQMTLGRDIHYVKQIGDLMDLLRRVEPALWLLATTGNEKALALHAECRAVISR
jgi:hypothetical protein